LLSGCVKRVYKAKTVTRLVPVRSRVLRKCAEEGAITEPIKIMPCLEMKDGRVVKGVHFVDLKDAGDPVEHAAFYNREGADELAMLDIAATLENRKTRLEWVKNVSSVIDIPLTVGGGIGDLEDIELVLGQEPTRCPSTAPL
jgi:phosphoribosylformimino-5-aminoimidazole carboxamide ribonucleotide (ProFAR) isomerase